ncbi:hypothetical protein TREMEDRAFT_66258 [Tremella mesenterica DSM 1558]|uniref:uncharacterized protein n=1 Tax=Tremella mesenterica (strain ATCC 24925 / CBS 8224 / DSM 1558 / NBRC 9311 / NRRL Y-6157 / RJB 2259-6 / UBC 559-6) TaxID=578456 RepID=UPI00032CC1C5|nr:uncharacterized protein TREMEDRAFT_66258 [Tremella mesenterica DSM 1558]EIW65670.1 hypothetical protein TREMEDRAFT_66258 [Tremella mesenterica DSM 1558]
MTLGGPSRPKRPLPSPVDLTTPTPPKQTGPLDQYFLFKPGPSPSKPADHKGKGRVIDLTSDTSSNSSKLSKAASTRSASDEDLPSVYDQLVKSWSQQGIAHSLKTKVSQTQPSSQAQSYPHGSKLKTEPISPITKRHKNRPATSQNFVASSSLTSDLPRKAKIYPLKGHGTFHDPLEILSSEGSSSSGTPREPLITLPNPRKPSSVPVSSISVPPARPPTKDLHENSALVSQVSLPLLSDITSVPITASPLKSRPGRGAFGSHVKRSSMSPGALKGRSINPNLSQTSCIDTFAPKDDAYHPHSTSDRSQPSKRIELRKRDNAINYEIPALDAEHWPIGPRSHTISSKKESAPRVQPVHPVPAHSSPPKTSSPLTPVESQDSLWSLNPSPEHPRPQAPPEPLTISESMFAECHELRRDTSITPPTMTLLWPSKPHHALTSLLYT